MAHMLPATDFRSSLSRPFTKLDPGSRNARHRVLGPLGVGFRVGRPGVRLLSHWPVVNVYTQFCMLARMNVRGWN